MFLSMDSVLEYAPQVITTNAPQRAIKLSHKPATRCLELAFKSGLLALPGPLLHFQYTTFCGTRSLPVGPGDQCGRG